jgi:cytochrome c biogenesis protein CcmG, thiol:disulfide interchange protein DsbE
MSNRPKPKPTSSARVAQARSSDASGGKTLWWVFGGLAVVVLVAAILAVSLGTRSDDTGSGTAAGKTGGTVVVGGPVDFGDVRVVGAALPSASQTGGADPAVGQAVPEIKGEQFNGNPITIPASGNPKVVMFVAHWCPHCQKEVPEISQYLAQNGMPAGVDLYTVATSSNETRPNFPASKWLVKEQWPVPTLVDDAKNGAANAYGVTGFPYFVVVGADGKVLARTSGEITMTQFQQLIDQAKATAPATPGTTAAVK